ncbi:MAG: hypothetical protein AABY51_10245, partial [Deltaproteobacteria bacterium]
RSKYRRLLVVSPLGSFHHTRVCLKTKQLRFNYLLNVSLSDPHDQATALVKNICLILALHFCAPFWVGLPSLSNRLAVDTDACSSSLLYAYSTIPGFISGKS